MNYIRCKIKTVEENTLLNKNTIQEIDGIVNMRFIGYAFNSEYGSIMSINGQEIETDITVDELTNIIDDYDNYVNELIYNNIEKENENDKDIN